MINSKTTIYKSLLIFQTILKWLELAFAGIFTVLIFWIFYKVLCYDVVCQQVNITQQQLVSLLQFILPLVGLLNSLRIGLLFVLNDKDKIPETFFYLGLIGLFISYSIFGLFFNSFLYRGENTLADSPVLIIQVFVLLITISLLLADRQTWDKSTAFIRLRISLSLIHLVLFLINPVIGLLASVIIIPISVIAGSRKKSN